MMKGKMMEEKIRIPENGSPIPVLHHFAQSSFCQIYSIQKCGCCKVYSFTGPKGEFRVGDHVHDFVSVNAFHNDLRYDFLSLLSGCPDPYAGNPPRPTIICAVPQSSMELALWECQAPTRPANERKHSV